MKKNYILTAALAVCLLGGSNLAKAQNELVVGDVKVGDKITLSDGSEWYVGPNEITNPSFSMNPTDNNGNIVGWTVGDYAQMTTGNFTWHPEGGYDGGAYIQASYHTGANGTGSICQRWNIEPNTRYYLSFYLARNSENNQYIPVITLTDRESTGGGQNEKLSDGALQLIGKNGEDSGEILGYGNYVDNDGDGYGDWCQTACSFESQEYTYCQFNARWLKESTIQACFDGFFLAKLYDPTTTSPEKVAEISLLAELSRVEEIEENNLADYQALAEELQNWIMESGYDNMNAEDNTLEEIQNAIDAIKQKVSEITTSVANFEAFATNLEAAIELIDNTSYPGLDDFTNVVTGLLDYQADNYYPLDKDKTASEYILVATQELDDAVKAYRFSQEATEDNPADYTFYINNPTFVAQGNWYIGSTGGDQRLHTGLTDNNGNAMTAWNAWSGSLSSESAYVSINQDLTGLPNGKYTVTADLCTQDGCITDQHVFASSSTSTSESPVMTQTGWDPYLWETLKTTSVIVVDGKLTIGVIGHGINSTPAERGGTNTDYRCGWFCVSNFKLHYLGVATDEEYAEAMQGRIAEAAALVDTMHYAGDKAALQAVIDATKTANDLDSLNTAIETAIASEADYASVTAGTYKVLQDSIATATSYTDNAKKVAQVPVDYMTKYLASPTATYTETGAITTVLRYYHYTLIPTIIELETTQVSDPEAKIALEGTLNYVISQLGTYQSSTSLLAAYVEQLEEALRVAKLADIQYGAGADVTDYIVNAEVTDSYATGWTINKIVGDGNGVKNGQADNGVSSDYYIDTYNSTPGAVRATYYQVLYVPNGTYRLSAQQRNAGGGYYLFASTAAPTLNADSALALDPTATNVLALAKSVPTPAKYILGATEDGNMTDSYGAIWMEAADKVMAKFGITGVVNADEATGVQALSIYDAALEANEGNETCPEGIEEADWNVFIANNGIGRGWFNNSLEITVENHVLTVGVSCDSVFTEGFTDTDGNPTVPFTGTWFSANNFKLVMVSEGNNTGWNPATGIEAVEPEGTTESTKVVAIYNVAGAQVSSLQKGVNIVKYADGTTKKVLVK